MQDTAGEDDTVHDTTTLTGNSKAHEAISFFQSKTRRTRLRDTAAKTRS